MDVEPVEELFKVIGCSNLKYGLKWVNATCPFAAYRHSKGSDKHPSFGIRVSTGLSHFRCLACGVVGDMHTLVWKLGRYKGKGDWYDQASRLVMRDTPDEGDLGGMMDSQDVRPDARARLERATYWGTSKTPAKPVALSLDTLEYPVLAEDDLRQFRELSPAARDYLMGPTRKLAPHTLELWELGWQPHARRIVVPVRDWDGRLVGLTGRAIDPDNKPKFLHSTGFKRDYFLFGEHLVERGERGYLVEGHFDAIYLRQMGYPNTVAVMGSWVSAVQVEKIVQMFSSVTIFPDGDDAGAQAAEKWEYALKGRLPVNVIDVVVGRDPDEYDQGELDDMLALDDSPST